MPDAKISALPAISTFTPATDVFPVVDVTAVTKKITTNQILGSGGIATLASATISGDLTVRTTGLTVNSSGVGVGVTAALGAGNIQIGAGKYLGFSGTAYITPEDNVQGARIKANQVLIDATDAKFNIGGSEAMRLNATGLAIGDTAFAGTRLTLRESASQPNALAMTNRNATQTWRIGVDVSAVDDKILGFYDSTSTTFRMQLTDTGHLGIGVTPYASWPATSKALQLGASFAIEGRTNDGSRSAVYTNAVWNGTNLIYQNTAAASYYLQSSGVHSWYNAASGTAGNAITFTQAMTLDASGNLVIGKTSALARLDVASTRAASVVGGVIGTTGTGSVNDEVQFLIKNVNTASGQNNGAGIGGLLEASASNKSSLLFYVDNGTAVTNVGRFDSNGNLILQSSATPATLATNGQLTMNATSNTNLRFSYRGSDGITRVANLTLA